MSDSNPLAGGANIIRSRDNDDSGSSISYILRTGQVIGGIGQVGLGIAVCSGGVSCAVGGLIALKGIDNIQAGFRGITSFSQNVLTNMTRSEYVGGLLNAGIDIGTSIGGLARNVPKLNAFGNTEKSLFVKDLDFFEPAFRQVTPRALRIEALTAAGSVIDVYKD